MEPCSDLAALAWCQYKFLVQAQVLLTLDSAILRIKICSMISLILIGISNVWTIGATCVYYYRATHRKTRGLVPRNDVLTTCFIRFSLARVFFVPCPPEGVANQEGYLRWSKRFDHIISYHKLWCCRWKTESQKCSRCIQTHLDAFQGMSTLKDECLRQFRNRPFREIYCSIQWAKYDTNWRHYG